MDKIRCEQIIEEIAGKGFAELEIDKFQWFVHYLVHSRNNLNYDIQMRGPEIKLLKKEIEKDEKVNIDAGGAV